jgi:hypothetical protein
MSERNFKEEFDDIIKNVIAPIFKEKGFKKYGLNFHRESGEIIQVFNIQRGRYNTQTHISFIFNVGIEDKDLFNKKYDREISKKPKEYECGIRSRFSNVKNNEEQWYLLNKKVNLDDLKKRINKEIRKNVIPFLDKNIDPKNWISLVNSRKNYVNWIYSKFLITLKYGEKSKADKILRDYYQENLDTKKPSGWFQDLKDYAKKYDVDLESDS